MSTSRPISPIDRAPLTRDDVVRIAQGRVDIIGAATAEGVAVARLLLRLGCRDIILRDSRERAVLRKAFRTVHGGLTRIEQDSVWQDEIRPLLDNGYFGPDWNAGLESATTVVLGQGWYLNDSQRESIEQATRSAACTTSMTELYLALAPGRVAAVTGTNGKSTTLALADHLLTAAGIAHQAAGNERSYAQFLHELADASDESLTLLEISNRQLMQVAQGVDIAALTEITPDHLEEHGGWNGYRAAKRRLFALQVAAGATPTIAIANTDSPECASALAEAPASIHVACGIGERQAPAVFWSEESLIATGIGDAGEAPVVIAHRDDVQIPGDHNLRNVAVAVAIALAAGATRESVAGALRSFTGPALRMQQLADVRGVHVFSDLKATTPEATMAALAALGRADGGAPESRLVLIAGGDDKQLNYEPLARAIDERGAACILVPGTASEVIAQALAVRGVDVTRVDDIASAIDVAFATAQPGDIMLISPAAAGFWSTQLQGATSVRTLIAGYAAGDTTEHVQKEISTR